MYSRMRGCAGGCDLPHDVGGHGLAVAAAVVEHDHLLQGSV